MTLLHPTARSGRLRHDESTISYQETDSTARSTVVLVHGTGGRADTHFRTVFPMLAARHRVIALDLCPADSLDALSAQVIAVTEDRARNEPVTLVGYSLGALVAAKVAASRPELVARLVLICGWARPDSVQRLRYGIWQSLFAAGDRDTLSRFSTLLAFGQPYLAARTDSEVEALVSAREYPEGIEQQMRINAASDVVEDLSRVTAPTLVISGIHDQMVARRHGHYLFGAIEDARLAEIATGHAATTERPAQVFKLVDDFIRDLPHISTPGQLVDTVSI